MSLSYSEYTSRADTLRARRMQRSAVLDSQARNVIGVILAITVFAVPFDSILNIGALGEMAHESYPAIDIACAPIIIILMLSTGAIKVPMNLVMIFFLIVLVVFVSFVANASSILSAYTKGRNGLGKLISAALVPIFGMYVAILIYNISSWNFRKWFLLPLLLSATVVILIGLVEFASGKLGLGRFYSRLYLITHVGFSHIDFNGGALENAGATGNVRVMSVLFEPSDFGAYLLYVIPWLLALYFAPSRARRSALPPLLRHCFYLPLIGAAIGLAFFSGRTAAIGMPLIVLSFFALCFLATLLRDRQTFGLISWLIVIGIVMVYLVPIWGVATYTDYLASAAIATGNTSNVSRLGTVVILLNLFKDNPLFGIGFGQYGFYVAQYVPGWAYTYEFKRWLGDLNGSFFPTFSVFARLAGETGLFGLLTWVGFLAYLIRKVTRSVRTSYVENKSLPFLGVAVITSFISMGLTGLSLASFRVFWIWALLGVAACYVYKPHAIDGRRT